MRNSHFIEEERRYAQKDWMKIRINDLARNRVDGIERMDQVGREEKNDGRGKGKVGGRIWFMIKNRKRRQSIIAASFRCEWEISAAKKNLLFCLRVRVIYMRKKGAVIVALRRSWTFLPSFLQSNASLHSLSHICFSLVTLSLFWLCSRVIRIIMIKLVVGFFTV